MSGADQFMMIGFNLNIFVLKASNVALAGLLFKINATLFEAALITLILR